MTVVYPCNKVPRQQADAEISQANPVSGTLYTVLDTALNVEINSLNCKITWAVTQPTNLKIVITVDGQTLTFTEANPVSGADRYAEIEAANGMALQGFGTGTSVKQLLIPICCSGRKVKVECGITWAVTQPTPLVCRVKYVKW